MSYLSRISARLGEVVGLNTTFYHNGVASDPHKIHKVEIYKCSYNSHNLVAEIPISDGTLYPSPVEEVFTETVDSCNPTSEILTRNNGTFILPWIVPDDFDAPSVYLDVWHYWGNDPCDGTSCDYESLEVLSKLHTCCSKFWVYPSSWFCDDGTCTASFAFQPTIRTINKPDTRFVIVNILPLPLYSCSSNLFNIFPFCTATYSIGTQNCEILVDSEPAEIVGISNRTFPYGIKFKLNSASYLKGTYWYSVMVQLPDGTSRTSEKFYFSIQ